MVTTLVMMPSELGLSVKIARCSVGRGMRRLSLALFPNNPFGSAPPAASVYRVVSCST